MMAFRFSLDQVLGLQRQLEEQAKFQLVKILARLNLEKQKLRDLNQLLTDLQETSRQSVKTEGIEFKQLFTYSQVVNEKILRQQRVVDEALRDVRLARTKLLSIRWEVKKLERLREKRITNYLYLESRREQAILDEVATGRYIKDQT